MDVIILITKAAVDEAAAEAFIAAAKALLNASRVFNNATVSISYEKHVLLPKD